MNLEFVVDGNHEVRLLPGNYMFTVRLVEPGVSDELVITDGIDVLKKAVGEFPDHFGMVLSEQKVLEFKCPVPVLVQIRRVDNADSFILNLSAG